jgi:hypothetical protein
VPCACSSSGTTMPAWRAEVLDLLIAAKEAEAGVIEAD